MILSFFFLIKNKPSQKKKISLLKNAEVHLGGRFYI